MKKNISYICPIFIIFLAVFVFFWKFFLKGLIPIPADITVGMYYPWLDYKWGYAVGVPVKNSLLSDVVSQIYPFRTYAMSLIKQGIVPLWNPALFGGYPLLANTQVSLFNPTNIFYLFLAFPKAWGIQIVFQPLLAALFSFLFLRSVRLGKLASLLGSLIYSFSGFMMVWLQWNVHGFAIAFLPILLYLINEYYQSDKALTGPLISLFLCLQIFSGYPQVVFYTILVLFFYVLIMFGFRQKKNIFLILWVILGLALSGIQLLPTIELFSLSQKRFEVLDRNSAFVPWQYLISFFAPDYFGNITTGNFWGKGDYTANIGFSGVASLLLTIITLKEAKRKKIILFFWLLLILSLLLALPNPLSFFVNNLKIIGLESASMNRVLFLTNFSIAVLAAFSFDLLQKKQVKRKQAKSAFLVLIIIGGVFLGTFLAYRMFIYLGRTIGDSFSTKILESWLRNLKVGMKNLILPGIISFSMIILVWASFLRIKIFRGVLLLFIFFLTIAELFRFGWKFNPFSDSKLLFPETPVISFIKNQKGIFRVEGGETVPMNMLMPFGIESFSAYDPMYPLRISEYLSLNDSGSIEKQKSRYGQFDNYSGNLFDLANICFVYGVKRDETGKPDSEGYLKGRFKLTKFKEIFEDRTVVVLKNISCFPRAYLFYDYEIIENNERTAARLAEKDFLIRKKVVIEKVPGITLEREDNNHIDSKIEWLNYQSGKESLKISSSQPSFLFISESFYPGWEAFIDGNKTEIFRADFVFRGAFVPEGEHTVEFIYNPFSFKIGKIVSLFTFVILVGYFFIAGVFAQPRKHFE